jgi:hypothetical protein
VQFRDAKLDDQVVPALQDPAKFDANYVKDDQPKFDADYLPSAEHLPSSGEKERHIYQQPDQYNRTWETPDEIDRDYVHDDFHIGMTDPIGLKIMVDNVTGQAEEGLKSS